MKRLEAAPIPHRRTRLPQTDLEYDAQKLTDWEIVGSGEWQLASALLSKMANSDVGSGEWQLAAVLFRLLRGTANVFGGRGQVACSTSHVRIQAGVPGIGVKLALCELEHTPRCCQKEARMFIQMSDTTQKGGSVSRIEQISGPNVSPKFRHLLKLSPVEALKRRLQPGTKMEQRKGLLITHFCLIMAQRWNCRRGF